MNVSRKTIAATVLAASLFHSASASAIALFSQIRVAGDQSVVSDFTWENQMADNFSFSNNVIVNQIRWWGNTGEGNFGVTDNFKIRFFADNGSGLPGAQIGGDLNVGDVVETSTGVVDIAGIEINQYDLNISPLSFSAGQTYYISIINALSVNDPWLWSFISRNRTNYFRPTDGDTWTTFRDGDLAFRLFGWIDEQTRVPEPASLGLLMTGIAGLAIARRRRPSR